MVTGRALCHTPSHDWYLFATIFHTDTDILLRIGALFKAPKTDDMLCVGPFAKPNSDDNAQ